MGRIIRFVSVIVLVGLSADPGITRPSVVRDDDAVVVYEMPLQAAAKDVLRLVPVLKKELEVIFGWRLDVRPRIILVKDNQSFQRLAHQRFYVAFALPARNLVVIDYSKMNIRPFTLGTTLKHELCHLLLHQHIDRAALPRWLDEGVCQWASDGMAEVLLDQGHSVLNTALLSNRLMPFARLQTMFPDDKPSLVLAYEQSKSIVDYISQEYGRNAILDILACLEKGDSVDTAI